MSTLHARGRIGDAALAAGATIILLRSSSITWIIAGIALILLGAALQWATPRPDLRTRMLASVAGLLIGFGAAIGGPGRLVAIASGALLLAGVLLALRRR